MFGLLETKDIKYPKDTKKVKARDDNRLFVICDKCDTKIYEHTGLIYKTKDKIWVFKIHCPKCDIYFDNIMQKAKDRKRKEVISMSKSLQDLLGKDGLNELMQNFQNVIDGKKKEEEDDKDA